MDFEQAFEYIGEIGPYQVMIFVLLGMVHLFNGLQNMAMNFIRGHQDHWCKVPRLEDFPHEVQKYIAIPYSESGDSYDSCSMFDLPYDNLTDQQIFNWNRSFVDNASTITCEEWVVDKSEFVTTINSDVSSFSK